MNILHIINYNAVIVAKNLVDLKKNGLAIVIVL